MRGCNVAEVGAFCAGENRTNCFPGFSKTIPHGVEGDNGPESWPRDWAEAVQRPVYNAVSRDRQSLSSVPLSCVRRGFLHEDALPICSECPQMGWDSLTKQGGELQTVARACGAGESARHII